MCLLTDCKKKGIFIFPGLVFPYFAYFAYFDSCKVIIINSIILKKERKRLTTSYFALLRLLRFTTNRTNLQQLHFILNVHIQIFKTCEVSEVSEVSKICSLSRIFNFFQIQYNYNSFLSICYDGTSVSI